MLRRPLAYSRYHDQPIRAALDGRFQAKCRWRFALQRHGSWVLGRATLQPSLNDWDIELSLLVVIRTEDERHLIVSHRGRLGLLVVVLRRLAPSLGSGTSQYLGTRGRSNLVVATSDEKSIRLLRPSGSSGSCRRRVRSNQASRAAARARALLNIVGSRLGPTFGVRPVLLVTSRAVLTVNVLGSARFRRCCAALGVVRRAGTIARVSVWRRLICRAV